MTALQLRRQVLLAALPWYDAVGAVAGVHLLLLITPCADANDLGYLLVMLAWLLHFHSYFNININND